MCWLYGRIYLETKRRRADLVCLQAHHSQASSVLRDDDSSDADVSWPKCCAVYLDDHFWYWRSASRLENVRGRSLLRSASIELELPSVHI